MSRWSDVVRLIGIKETINGNGFEEIIETIGDYDIFANKLPVHSAEFYQASQAGFKVSALFKIHSAEYDGQEALSQEGKRFNIVRTYDKGEFVDLSCERRDDSYE